MRKYFFLIGLVVFAACNSRQKNNTDPDVYYTCSMDPQVVESKPGKCPICKMELTAVRKSQQSKNNEIKLSPEQIRLGNIHVDTIREGSFGNQLVLTGTLNFDQLKTNAISARIKGRIDKLYYKNVGDYVQKGAKLFDLYSEELNNAKQEYLLALQKSKTLANSIVDYDQLIRSAKNKLLLWGMTESQLMKLANTVQASSLTSFYATTSGYITELNVKEGDYVNEGGNILRLADLSTLWVEVQVYSSLLSQINRFATVNVKIPDFPDMQVQGRIEFVNPEINTDTRINLIRVSIPNQGRRLKPGMPAYVIIKDPAYKTLSLPADAVLRDGKMAMVWIQTGPNTYTSRMVETGMESNGVIEIKSGLRPGEAVVMTGAYLLQSEYVFRKGSNPMSGMKM